MNGSEGHAEVLARVLRALNSPGSGTTEPLYAILRAILAETDADRGFLMVYDADALRFELGLARSGRRLGAIEFAVSTTIVERALETGRCVVIKSVRDELPATVSSSAQELGLAAALCAPLRVERRRPGAREGPALPQVAGTAGVLYVDATRPGKFAGVDAGFFETLAHAAVLALRARATTGPERPEASELPLPDAELARHFPGIVTRDPAMRSLLALAERAAMSEANILVRGESGTGKELLARAVHARSLRSSGPFEVLDGTTIGEELAPSILFGHERGAFTGATAASPGVFERATGGTLFLDNVSELPLPVQGSLLRVLQEGEIRRLGSPRVRTVSARVVGATSRDLRALVERGEFRHDLLFRLAVVELKLPPLRERKRDVPLLVRHFVQRTGRPVTVEAEALARLEEHGWPGNVRELENTIARVLLDSPDAITRPAVDRLLGARAPSPASSETMEDIERRVILERLRQHDWNQAKAAKSLGLDRNTLRRKIVRYGLAPGET